MSGCGCGDGQGQVGGPFAEGRELVEFVAQAHGGALRQRAIPGGGLATLCQGCNAPFVLKTHVGSCPACGGVHAVSPPRASDAANIQYAGDGFRLSEKPSPAQKKFPNLFVDLFKSRGIPPEFRGFFSTPGPGKVIQTVLRFILLPLPSTIDHPLPAHGIPHHSRNAFVKRHSRGAFVGNPGIKSLKS